jgi:polynucleotide 5'-kinase involved in rRNA processing
MVLEKDSSVLGYPGEISKPLDADHHGVCKYESRQDPLYITMRNVLKSLLDKLQATQAAKGDTETIPGRGRRGSDVREFLSVSELPDTDYTFFRDRWLPATRKWILEHSTFIDWFENTDNEARLLWIYGSTASGKSVLSSFIIDHLIREGRQC